LLVLRLRCEWLEDPCNKFRQGTFGSTDLFREQERDRLGQIPDRGIALFEQPVGNLGLLGRPRAETSRRDKSLQPAAAEEVDRPGGIGRIGCFLVGDDYGRPTDLPWGVAFENGLPPTTAFYLRQEFGIAIPADVPGATLLEVHPTQLYETAAALLIWFVGVRLLARRRRPGDVAIPVLALLAVERFLVEFLRAKDDRFLGPFTVAQAISVAVVVALALFARSRPAAESGE